MADTPTPQPLDADEFKRVRAIYLGVPADDWGKRLVATVEQLQAEVDRLIREVTRTAQERNLRQAEVDRLTAALATTTSEHILPGQSQGRRRRPVIGPCGDQAEVPDVNVRRVDTEDGPMVEIAVTSDPYCWRVRSWWTPSQATAIADALARAAQPQDADDGR